MWVSANFTTAVRRYKTSLTALILCIIAILMLTVFWASKPEAKPDYSQLLNTIAEGESRGNYNAYYGNVRNESLDFTKMTVKEVLAWQREFVEKGSRSSAVGKYQFIRPTLARLVKEHRISGDERFSEELQDKLAGALLERRGINDYMEGKIDRKQFAHNLSKEWAALPKVIGENSEKSYYEGDGLNKVQISVGEVYEAIDSLTAEKIAGERFGQISGF